MKSRRQFLADSLRTLTLLGLPIQTATTIVETIVNKAYAGILDSPENKNSYKLVQILLESAPPRWLFDLPLTPNGNDKFDVGSTNSFGNKLKITGSQVDVIHSSWKSANGLYVPPVWSLNVPGQASFQSLLNHTLFVRGIDAEIDNHGLNRMRVDQPIIGGTSLTGAVSDTANHPIPGVHVASSATTFRSDKNKNAIRTNAAVSSSDNPVKRVLSPFLIGGTTFYRKDPGWDSAVGQVLDQFDAYAASIQIPKSSLRENHDKADALVREGVSSLVSQWAGVYQKYTSLVTTALSPAKGTLPGFFDKAIPVNNTNQRYRLETGILPAASMTDFRDVTRAGLTMNGLAASFAAAEILLTSGVTSTFTLGFDAVRNIDFGLSAKQAMTNDQHRVGNIATTVITTLQYRSLLACLTEFMETSKSAGTWDTTIVQIGSEFNRAPRADGTGSDHGVRGSNMTLISGMFQKAQAIGNILVEPPSTSANYRGTWGVATNYKVGSETRRIRYNDIARTISAMTGCADIVANGSSLVKPSGSQWVAINPEAKNVA